MKRIFGDRKQLRCQPDERHQTEAGQSSIAFASIFSGMQADGHGIFSMPQRMAPEVRLVREQRIQHLLNASQALRNREGRQ